MDILHFPVLIKVDVSTVRFAIYSGDVNQDGIIDLTDSQLIDNDAYNFASGYLNTDLNNNDRGREKIISEIHYPQD